MLSCCAPLPLGALEMFQKRWSGFDRNHQQAYPFQPAFVPGETFRSTRGYAPVGFACFLVVGRSDHSSFGLLRFCPNFVVDWLVMKDLLEGYRSLSFQKQPSHLLLKESMGQTRRIRTCK